MGGTATSTAAFALKSALFDAATKLWQQEHPEMLVEWGTLGANVPDNVMLVLGTDSEQEPGPLSSTNRSREETLHVEVQFFITRWGEEGAAREADQYLYDRLGELELHVRQTDTTLGGLVRHCFLVTHLTDSRSFTRNNHAGRIAAAIARFEAKVRITG